MHTTSSHCRRCCIALAAAASFWPAAALAQPALVLDNFDAGDQLVGSSTGGSFGTPVPGVFSGNRIMLLVKQNESSATTIAVGGGQLSWVQTSSTRFGDYGVMYDDAVAAPPADLSAYNAFRLTVVSAPANPGAVDFMMVFSLPGNTVARRATAAIPTSGVVTVPFSLLSRADGFAFDLTQVRGVGLEFAGGQMSAGTYVFDDFQAVAVVPEPSRWALMGLGLLAAAWRGRLRKIRASNDAGFDA